MGLTPFNFPAGNATFGLGPDGGVPELGALIVGLTPWELSLAASEAPATHALAAITNSVLSMNFLEVFMALPFKARATP
jgi:hypothetical protein